MKKGMKKDVRTSDVLNGGTDFVKEAGKETAKFVKDAWRNVHESYDEVFRDGKD